MDINRILAELRQESERINDAIQALESLDSVGGKNNLASATPAARRVDHSQRRLSAAARRKISEAAKARWARERAAKARRGA